MNPMQSSSYKQLVSLTKRLGGKVVVVPKEEWEGDGLSNYPISLGPRGWSTAPFCSGLGVYWNKKVIAHTTGGWSCAGLIHEMGHVFACKKPPHSKYCEETDFLAWELELSKRLGIYPAWLREMSAYGINDTDGHFHELGDLEPSERKVIFAQHRLDAIRLGSIGPRGQLRSIRN